MVKIMEDPIKMDDLGVFPYFWKDPFLRFDFEFVIFFVSGFPRPVALEKVSEVSPCNLRVPVRQV